MLDAPVALAALAVVLAFFAWIGIRVGRDRGLEEFTVARGTQGGTALGLSFFASGVGAWILFAAPEVGATAGVAGAVGYAVAIVVPLVGLVLVGRTLRRVMPEGHGLIEFTRIRYGRAMHVCVLLISLSYMSIALTVELTATGALLGRLSDADPRIGIVGIAVVTSLYTAWGGLRASLMTDRWQSYLLLALLLIVGVTLAVDLPAPAADASGTLWAVDAGGIEGALTLIAAVTVTTLFHNGYWQRVWSARDQSSLRRGALIGAAIRFPIVLVAGLVGLVAAQSAVDLGTPPAPFFALLTDFPAWVLIAVLLLATALVASTIDTLQNGLAAIAVTERPAIGLTGARVVTVAVTLVAVLVAFQGFSVLRLLLIADVLCAAAVIPALLGLWRRSTATGAVTGTIAGLVGAGVYGWVVGGSLAEAIDVATFADGLSLGPFAAALLTSAAVTVTVSLAGDRDADLTALGADVDSLDAATVTAARRPPAPIAQEAVH